MESNLINKLVIDVEKSLGDLLVVGNPKPYMGFKNGIKTGPEGLSIPCISVGMNYEKINVKVVGIMQTTFVYEGTPIPIVFEGLEGKIWRDFSNNGDIRLSVMARGFTLQGEKTRLKLNEGRNRE